jgi:ATP/maltotriose-dependent transcriptional regulator MalT
VAARLFITAGTARIHLKNIYRKLDIHSRLQAVERARAVNLLYMPLGVKHVSANVK